MMSEESVLMNITLTPDLDKALAEKARALGTTPEQLAIERLREIFTSNGETSSASGSNLADFLGDSIGVLHSGEHVPQGAKMTEMSGEQFRSGLIQRHRQGQS